MDLNRRLQRRVRIRKTDPYLLLQRAQNWSVNCYLDEAVVFMRSECNGRTDCYIHPDVFTVEKDPCPGTERYLEAHYRCTPNQGNHTLPTLTSHTFLLFSLSHINGGLVMTKTETFCCVEAWGQIN